MLYAFMYGIYIPSLVSINSNEIEKYDLIVLLRMKRS